MTDQELLEGNELIADFLGWKRGEDPDVLTIKNNVRKCRCNNF